uniref:Uncharacterized protein n=1 Tax=viral metagenome TaxID=1070528 RepID=A0A6C0EN73_9ZZZZ
MPKGGGSYGKTGHARFRGSLRKKDPIVSLHRAKAMTGGASALVGGAVAGSEGGSTQWGLVLVILALIGVIAYLISLHMGVGAGTGPVKTPTRRAEPGLGLPSVLVAPVSTRTNPYGDPLSPPLKSDGVYFPPDSGDIRGLPMVTGGDGGSATCNSATCGGMVGPGGVGRAGTGLPINMRTRGYSPDFSQIGLLTRERADRTEDTSFRDPMILPLFGRRVLNGRDKYQYYTMSNTGAVNTKLPVKVRGRNCVNEYGCDELMNQDTVYVEGYNDVFRATIYESNTFSYIPYL